MILAYAIILLILLAILLRRDVSAIGHVSLKGGVYFVGLIVGLFVLQAVTLLYVPGQSVGQRVILNLSQIGLILLFAINHHLPGAKLFALGILLNIVVMLANGGLMPITPETYSYVHPDRPITELTRPPNSKNIILPRDETNLWILSDIVPLNLPWRRTAVSLGDILLVVGAGQFIFQTTAKKKEQLVTSQTYS